MSLMQFAPDMAAAAFALFGGAVALVFACRWVLR